MNSTIRIIGIAVYSLSLPSCWLAIFRSVLSFFHWACTEWSSERTWGANGRSADEILRKIGWPKKLSWKPCSSPVYDRFLFTSNQSTLNGMGGLSPAVGLSPIESCRSQRSRCSLSPNESDTCDVHCAWQFLNVGLRSTVRLRTRPTTAPSPRSVPRTAAAAAAGQLLAVASAESSAGEWPNDRRMPRLKRVYRPRRYMWHAASWLYIACISSGGGGGGGGNMQLHRRVR